MFKLIELPYTSLAPVISDQTLAFHHGKHLQTYVDNLNKLIAGTEFEGKSLEEIVKSSTGGVFNNAGQILNHEMYFTQFTPQPSLPAPGAVMPGPGAAPVMPASGAVMPGPTGHLAQQIKKQWGTIDAFKAEFEAKGTGLFGSGWVWLQADDAGELSIAQYPNADNPLAHVMPGLTGHLKPILTFDVWEHAYYLDYQNRRAAHLAALWQIVNWEVIEARYTR